jgi:thiamine-phosphate pyrophosphorylase
LSLPHLYAILDIETVTERGWDPADACLAWLSAGVRLIQLRAKRLASGPFLELADEVTALCRESGALLIINDRADIAAMAGAAGVHLGQDDLSPADARTILAGSAIVGLSTHDRDQAASGVAEPVSYLAIGPVYATATKATGYEALGLEPVREASVVTAAAGLPLVAIGGITLERAGAVLAAGADSVAVISGLLAASNVAGVEACARAWVRQTG